MSMKRSRAAELGRDTVRILEAGHYTAQTGDVVPIADLLRCAVQGTCSYPPEQPLPEPAPGATESPIEVANESTLAAAQRLIEAGHRPVALNFASAKHPGGGFLGGARAQEESLARSSGLYACINANEMYRLHSSLPDALYTNYAIYSPDVPVFRDDEGALLAKPYLCAFITAPAVNAKVVLERDWSRRPQIREAMRERIRKVLAIAALHGHDALVLGAWGCGVFGNDSQEIAELFREALAQPFRGVFARVVFAILDWSEEQRFIGPFLKIFGESASGPA
jgi:uncharacterized protein (TIGR02452 family)